MAQQQFNATNQARIPANGIKSDSAQKFRGTTKPSDLGRITSPARHSSVCSTEGRQVCRSSKDKSARLTRNDASIAANSSEAPAKKTKAHQPRPKASPFPGQTGHDQTGGYLYPITSPTGHVRNVLQNTFMTKGRRVVPINEYAEKL